MMEEKGVASLRPSGAVLTKVIKGRAERCEARFTDTFVIGRSKECDLQIKDDVVSRQHAKVLFDGERWCIRDLESGNGTYVNGVRILDVPLPDEAEIELGKGGPLLLLRQEMEEELPRTEETQAGTKDFTSETQIIRHYLDKSCAEEAGEQTMMFRRAFERVQKKKSRKYLVVIGIALFLLVAAGSIIIYQKNKLLKLRTTAESIFYTMKSLELQIAKLEEIVLLSANADQIAELRAKRKKFKEMEKEYDNFVKELGIYNKLPEDERIMLRIARVFGECEVNMPKGFVKEVRNYISKWQSGDRLAKALNRAKSKGYTPVIMQVMAENNLPPHFFFLALQESDFDERAIGPQTRYGYAKGIWQFISLTGNKYGLQVGPLYDKAEYDPLDERFNFGKSTVAAGRYLRDINNTEAQASGLLVMASYNWGENNIRQIIRQMPENPRERNFWRLLARKDIPRETYDYVFYIFSAAVICENPRLFGLDIECPKLSPQGRHEGDAQK